MPHRAAATYRRVLFPSLPSDTHVPPFFFHSEGSKSQYVDVAAYQVLAVVCRQYILSWYGTISNDRQFLQEALRMWQPLVHAVQKHTGAYDTSALPLQDRDAAYAQRVRIAAILCERVPCILTQHVRQYHCAQQHTSSKEDVASTYEKLGAHPGVIHGALSDTYLRASVTSLLHHLMQDISSDERELWSKPELIIVRDVLVFSSHLMLERATPSVLCGTAHSLLDRLQHRRISVQVCLCWAARYTRSTLYAAVMLLFQSCSALWHMPSSRPSYPPTPAPSSIAYHGSSPTNVLLAFLSECFQLSESPFGAFIYAWLFAIVRLTSSWLDPYVP